MRRYPESVRKVLAHNNKWPNECLGMVEIFWINSDGAWQSQNLEGGMSASPAFLAGVGDWISWCEHRGLKEFVVLSCA